MRNGGGEYRKKEKRSHLSNPLLFNNDNNDYNNDNSEETKKSREIGQRNGILYEKGKIEEAEKVIKRWKEEGKYTPNQVTFNTLIHLCSRSGDMYKAEYWLSEMKKEGYEGDIYTLNSILQCCAVRSLPIAAQRYFDLLSPSIPPSAVTFTILINLYKRSILPPHKDKLNHNQTCFDKIESLLDLWSSLPSSGGLKIDRIMINSMIDLCKQAQDQEKAEKYFGWMVKKRIEPDTTTFLSLFSVFSLRGDLPKAMEYFEYMKKFKVKAKREVMNAMISVCAKAKSPSTADHLFSLFPSLGITPDLITFNTLINCHCQAGDVKKSKDYFNQILANNFTPTRYYLCSISQILSARCR